MSTMTAAYHCMILATFATWGSVGHISPITVVVQVRQVLVHQVDILAGQIFQAYLISTKKNAEENCSQPQSSSIRNYNFRDKAKINHFFRPSDSKNVEPPVGQTQRKAVSLLHTQVQPTKMFEYI